MKAIFQKRFDLLAFAGSQVLIDLESLVYLLQRADHVHRFLHTYLGATIVAIATIAATVTFYSLVKRSVSISAIVFGAFFGTYSHIVLDSIMHRDIRPFAPFFDSNGLLGVISLATLHDFCFFMGILGLCGITWRLRSQIFK
ncbi:hypothetical protein HOH87_02425 [bacterium]|jgi:membrane-bound metal-dependent hydrolase YbcI (DUF457 family)|nr:hypothetical protein [bacterium]